MPDTKINPFGKLRTKYIFVSGGVISGIGKGTTVASIAFLLKQAGFKVAPIKFENYLNIDAGTINPIEHGDPFLCEDGTEADMDIGSYEKFLDEDMEKDNFVTAGQIYKTVIDKERSFEFEGEDVEAIPYITNEIIRRIDHIAAKKDADVVIVELGGTAGEYQNIMYYEASRILTLKKPGDVVHVHVSYVPTPAHLGEPKTKPTQLSVRMLNSLGIQPDFIIIRSEKYLDQRRRDRLAMFCNVHNDDIISSPDVLSVYQIPIELEKQKLNERILQKLKLPVKHPKLSDWKKLIERTKAKGKEVSLAIVGKYFGTGEYELRDSYAALFDAINHASWDLGLNVKTHWVDAEKVEREGVGVIEKTNPDGIIVPIGWGVRGAEGMIKTASFAREKKIPYLGLCYGMQLAAVAYARDLLGFSKANTMENDPTTSHPVIHLMPKQRKFMKKRAYGGTMRLGGWRAKVKKGTIAYDIYRKELTSERHRHRYEFNDKYSKHFEEKGLIVSARSTDEGLAEIIELPKTVHPFYLGTQGHPEYKSRPLSPHPIFVAFLKACSVE